MSPLPFLKSDYNLPYFDLLPPTGDCYNRINELHGGHFMDLKNLFNFDNIGGVSDAYAIACTNYTNDGYRTNTALTEDGFISVRDSFTVTGKITEDGDVLLREDTITNTSDVPLTLYDYKARFCLSGEEYEVYTLYNNWQNESCGAWQELNATVVASAKGIRTNDCNVPMLAIYNKQTRRGIVFHLFPTAAWSITASKRSPSNRLVYTVIDIALNDDALSLTVNPGESFKMPAILYYEFTDKLSLDTPKMHRYMAKHYPRKQMPVIYNTWLAFFDRIELDNVFAQIEEAAALGCDYFTLDAGWFGDGTLWEYNIGNWTENTEGAYLGRMREVSDRVHAAGMKFGLWLEGERALACTPIVKAHPEYFFDNGDSYFLNFGYAPAREYITKLTLDLADYEIIGGNLSVADGTGVSVIVDDPLPNDHKAELVINGTMIILFTPAGNTTDKSIEDMTLNEKRLCDRIRE